MALNVTNLEGNEIADDYTRSSVPQGRWGDTWEVFKANMGKFLLINIFVLITFVPMIVLFIFRNVTINTMGLSYPFNPSIMYPLYPDVQGLSERVFFNVDLQFYALMVASGIIAALGVSGAAYSIRKIINTHGEFTVKTFFHGIKVNYFQTLLPMMISLLFLFATFITGDWMHVVLADGGNGAGAITAYVFVIIATVLACIYCAWLFAVGTTYKVSFSQLFKNAFVFMIGTPVQTIFMAGFSLIPVWLYMFGGFFEIIAYVLFILYGFMFVILCWTAFSQWVFDIYVNPNLKPADEKQKSNKKDVAVDKEEDGKRKARELLAAGKSDLISHPIMPISPTPAVRQLGKTFTRGDLSRAADDRKKLISDVSEYAKTHENDPVYVEYNKLFADREKALPSDTGGKKGKKKKISSDNLLQ